MAIDTQQKRMSVAGVGRPFMRAVFPVDSPTVEWRMSSGLVYAGNAVVTPTEGIALKARYEGSLILDAGYEKQPELTSKYQEQVQLDG